MCCVSIGIQDFLLPADTGLRVVELMKDAVPCEKRYVEGQFYVIRPQATELSMTIVRETQIRKEASNESARALLSND
jgi:hypothetical protein